MKKLLLFILFAFTLFSENYYEEYENVLFSIDVKKIRNSYYKVSDDKVYYLDEEIEADSATFKFYPGAYLGTPFSSEYAKDKNHVYYKGKILENSNARSFKVFRNSSNDGYAADFRNVYYNGKIMPDLDSSSFSITGIYSKDKNRVYINDKPLYNINPKNFVALESYGFNNDGIFYKEMKINGADKNTFQIISLSDYHHNSYMETYFSKDKNLVYYKENPLPDSDPNSFKYITSSYGKDNNSAYYQNRKIINSDPDSFEIINSSKKYTKDKNNIYYKENKLEGASPDNFTIISEGISKTDKYVYFKDKIIIGADPETFCSFPGPDTFWKLFYKDKHSIYLMGEKLNNIDYDSFILINSYTAKDKNNTYKANYNPDTDEHFLEIVN